MSPPTIWGPIIWSFFHTLVEKINDEYFHIIGFRTFNIIKQICKHLPCPDCSMHATQFLSKINFNHIKTKNDFKSLMYIFHNIVNKRKNKEMFNVMDLNMYKTKNLIKEYNLFVSFYNTKGNQKLMADSFARDITLKNVKSFLLNNRNFFNY
jgi:hypothetical protein